MAVQWTEEQKKVIGSYTGNIIKEMLQKNLQ